MIPEVRTCSVTDCFYNVNRECNAHGITVGANDAICDTYMASQQHTSRRGDGEVGACHISRCAFNQEMYCQACDDIEVAKEGDRAVCETFSPR